MDRLSAPRKAKGSPGRGPRTAGTRTTGAVKAGLPGRSSRGSARGNAGSGALGKGGKLSGLGKLGAKKPRAVKKVLGAGYGVARLQDRGLAAGVAAIGGVYAPGAYIPGTGGYGGHDYYHDDWYWGWYWGWYGGGWGWGWNWGWGWDWWFYQSWYYPYWYFHYRPYYYSYPSYYTTVIYRTVYEDAVEESAPQEDVSYSVVEPVGEPVGEAVVGGGQGEFPAAAEQGPLSVAAERYLTLGDRAFREGRYADAVQFYAKAVDFAPGEGALYLVLSDALFAAGDYHYAAYAVRKAFELEPTLVEAVVDKHSFYLDPAEFDRQLAVSEQYVLDHPTDRDARLVLALNMLFGGRPAVAVDLYESASAPASALQRDQAVELILRVAREVQYGAKQPSGG